MYAAMSNVYFAYVYDVLRHTGDWSEHMNVLRD